MNSTNSPEHYPFLKREDAQNSFWHIFWGDWSQSEKLPEIKPPLSGLLPVIVVAILISLTSQQRPIKLNCPLDLGVFLDVFQDKFKGTWDFRKIKDV